MTYGQLLPKELVKKAEVLEARLIHLGYIVATEEEMKDKLGGAEWIRIGYSTPFWRTEGGTISLRFFVHYQGVTRSYTKIIPIGFSNNFTVGKIKVGDNFILVAPEWRVADVVMLALVSIVFLAIGAWMYFVWKAPPFLVPQKT